MAVEPAKQIRCRASMKELLEKDRLVGRSVEEEEVSAQRVAAFASAVVGLRALERVQKGVLAKLPPEVDSVEDADSRGEHVAQHTEAEATGPEPTADRWQVIHLVPVLTASLSALLAPAVVLRDALAGGLVDGPAVPGGAVAAIAAVTAAAAAAVLAVADAAA